MPTEIKQYWTIPAHAQQAPAPHPANPSPVPAALSPMQGEMPTLEPTAEELDSAKAKVYGMFGETRGDIKRELINAEADLLCCP